MPDAGHAHEPAQRSAEEAAGGKQEPEEWVELLSHGNRHGFLALQLPGGSVLPCAVFRCRVNAKAGEQGHGMAALYPAVTIIEQFWKERPAASGGGVSTGAAGKEIAAGEGSHVGRQFGDQSRTGLPRRKTCQDRVVVVCKAQRLLMLTSMI